MRTRPSHFLTATIASLLLSFPLFAADTAVSLTERYSAVKVGSPVAIHNQTFQSGHLAIALTDGVAAPILDGTEVVGLYFKGSGSYEYLSNDPAEAAVLTSNVRNSTKLKTTKNDQGIVIRDTFTELFLRVAGREFPEPAGEAAASLDESFAAHQRVFARDKHSDAAFLFVQQKVDAPSVPVVRAQFMGGTEKMVYVHDALVTGAERLYSLYELAPRETTIKEAQEGLWPVPLSEQFIGKTRKQIVEPNFFLFDVDYTLTTASEHDASLQITETLIPNGRAQRVYRFDQYNTIYDTNSRPHRFTVKSVTDEAGNALPFVHRNDELLVSLTQPASKPFKIKFEITGDFLIRPSGDSYWELGTEPWFPQPFQNGQFFTVHSTVKVKKPFVPFAPGQTIRRVEEGDYNVVENRIDKPVRYAVVLAGKYSYEEETRDGLTIRVATYAIKNERATKQLANLAFTMIRFYEPFLGPFPFKEFNIIEINDFGFGQAPPGTMFITSEAFNPTLDPSSRIFSQGINHRYAHEIAHQYWGSVIKMASNDERWVNESFAEYSASLLIKEAKSAGDYKLMQNAWKTNANEAKALSSIVTAQRLRDVGNEGDAFWDRTHLIYDKGAYLLSVMHKELGDKPFLSFLRNFQARFAWKLTTTQDMLAVLQQVTNKDYTEFFEKNVYGTGMP
jgi:hypothetical protein